MNEDRRKKLPFQHIHDWGVVVAIFLFIFGEGLFFRAIAKTAAWDNAVERVDKMEPKVDKIDAMNQKLDDLAMAQGKLDDHIMELLRRLK